MLEEDEDDFEEFEENGKTMLIQSMTRRHLKRLMSNSGAKTGTTKTSMMSLEFSSGRSWASIDPM
jgi:hypothetical protein